MSNYQLKGANMIGGVSVIGKGESIHSYNPKTNESLSPAYPAVSDEDFSQAVDLAWAAFLEYRNTSLEKRAVFLETIADEIEAIGDTLVERAMLETGLPQARLVGERGRTCGQLRLFAKVLRDGSYQDIRHDSADPNRTPAPKPELYYRKIPVGPVAVFGASNFPLAFSVAGGDTASALASGCSVVVKAHNAHLGTSELVAQAVAKAVESCQMPKGVFSLLIGNGNTLGQNLVNHPHIKAVGFTGSRQGGMALMKTAANRPEPIPVYAEMSSINPVYLLPNALKNRGETIGKELVQAMMMGAGQFCTSPGLIFIQKGEGAEAFINSAKTALSEQLPQTMLTKGIANAFNQGTDAIKHSGIECLVVGQDGDTPNLCRPHLFLTNAKDFMNNQAAHEEVFGSSAVIIECQNFEEMLTITQSLEGQLTASIHSDDDEKATQLVNELELKVGRILFNGFGTGVEVSPAMVHGGPFPATSDGRSTSVGTAAIERFLRPVCYQNAPQNNLPEPLRTLKK